MCLGWKLSALTAVGTSITTSACVAFSLGLRRFQVHTWAVSVLQSPSSILEIKVQMLP